MIVLTEGRAERLGALAIVGLSAAALLAALIMQYWGGLPPCSMCVYQRIGYVAVIAGVLLMLLIRRPVWALMLGAALLTIEAGLAYYHWGVELGWIPLPATCSGIGVADDFDAFKASIMQDKPRCDQIEAGFLGLSIAAWNALFATSLVIGAIAVLVGPRTRRVDHPSVS